MKKISVSSFSTVIIACLALSAFAADFTLPLGENKAANVSLCAATPAVEPPTVAEALAGVEGLSKGESLTFLTENGPVSGQVIYRKRDINGLEARAGNLENQRGFFSAVAGPNVLLVVVEDFANDARYVVDARRQDASYSTEKVSLSEFNQLGMGCGTETLTDTFNQVAGAQISSVSALTEDERDWAANWDDDEVVELTIMVIFSKESLETAGSLERANAQVATGIGVGNTCMINSKVPATLVCVCTVVCDYEETVDSSLDLSRLANRTDGFEFVEALSKKVAADFCCYAPRRMTAGWAGLGYVNGSPSVSHFCANHVVLYSYLTSTSWCHEWGHNMGCNHSYEQSSSAGPESGGLFTHSLGAYFKDRNNNRFCSCMSYGTTYNGEYYSSRAPIFSGDDVEYQGGTPYLNAKTRNSLTWRKVRKYASLYTKPIELSEFDCSFSPDEGFYEGDATWQQGLISRSATGKIIKDGDNYYLHSQGGNGFEVPVNVVSDSGVGTFKVSVRVKPKAGGTYFDIRGKEDALCYLYVDSSSNLRLVSSQTPHGAMDKTVTLTGVTPDTWQTWTLWLDQQTHSVLAWQVDSNYGTLKDCYCGQETLAVKALWLKDVSTSGADFDDVHVDCGLADIKGIAKPFALGSNISEIILTNRNFNSAARFTATVIQGGEYFSLSPVTGVFRGTQTLQVSASNLPTTPGFVEGIVKIDAGNAGSSFLRFGAPCGNEADGYGLYAADFTTYLKGPIEDYDSVWETDASGTADLDYLFDHHVKEVLLDEDFERYAPNTNLGGRDGWSAGYGTIDSDGSIYARSEGGRSFAEISYIGGYFGAHKELNFKLKHNWWEGYLKGYFRISFDVKLTGDASKYFGLWNPQIVECNFQRNAAGYTFRSLAYDAQHVEFASSNPIQPGSWTRVSMIVEAVPIFATDGKYRHVLRQLKIGDALENCNALLGQETNEDYFSALRFFLWGEGTFCVDNLKVETLISQTDYEVLDFPEVDPVILNLKDGLALCNLGLTEEIGNNYDLKVLATLELPEAFAGKFTFGQDSAHRQFTTEFSLKDGFVKPAFPDCAEASALSEFKDITPGTPFNFGYDISSCENDLKNLFWNDTTIKADKNIEGAVSSSAIDALAFANPSSQEIKLYDLQVYLTPHQASAPDVSFELEPFTLGQTETTLTLRNTREGATANFALTFEDGTFFEVTPATGSFETTTTITVKAKNLPTTSEYVKDLLNLDFGSGGSGKLSVGCPCGSKENGYTLYDANYNDLKKDLIPQTFDPVLQPRGGAKLEVGNFADWVVGERLLAEDFERYENGKDLCGEDNWSVAYGAIDVNGSMLVKEEDGNKYLAIKDLTGLFGVHKKLDKTLPNDWITSSGYAYGFFRISFKARFQGSANKNFGLWTPQCAEAQFRADGDKYRFCGLASDATNPEFISENALPQNEWITFSMIVSAVPIKDSSDKNRHLLRYLEINGKSEWGTYLLDQNSDSETFSVLRFFQYGAGNFDIDEIIVEQILTNHGDDSQTFSADNFLSYVSLDNSSSATDDNGLFLNVAIPEGYSQKYDVRVRLGLNFPKTYTGNLTITQDAQHRQFQTQATRRNSDDKIIPSFADCAEAASLITEYPSASQTFNYEFKINTTPDDKRLLELAWGDTLKTADLAVSAGSQTDGIAFLKLLHSNINTPVGITSCKVTLDPIIPEPAFGLLIFLALAFFKAKQKNK